MFEPYLKSFYIRSTDPTQIKILKVSWKHLAEPVRGGFGASWSPFLGSPVLMPWDQEDIKALCPVTMPLCCPSLPLSHSWRSSPTWPTRLTSPPSCESSRYGHTEAATLAWLLVPNYHHGGGREEPLQEEWAEAIVTPSVVPKGPNV